MAMIPENPVVGGMVLRRAAIRSPNYVTNVSGWTINQDGSAEFNNIVIRNGQIISGTELFYSSLPPALGNLVASIAVNSGTDSAGNAYLPGITTYNKITAADFRAVQQSSGGLAWWTATAAGGPWNLVQNVALQADEVGVSFGNVNNANSITVGETAAALQVFGGAQIVTGPFSVHSAEIWIPPSGDTTGATDASNIQAALTAGQAVHLIPSTTNYFINQQIQIPGFGVLRGAPGHDSTAGFANVVIQQVNGANLDAMVASTGWQASSNTLARQPCLIEGINFQGNSAGQTSGLGHGVVLQAFRARIRDCSFNNHGGQGLRFDWTGRNGTTQLTNKAGECRIERCAFRNCGGDGFGTNDNTASPVFTDGFFEDNIMASCLTGVFLQSAAGWKITGNHCYTIQNSGIVAGHPYETRIADNYVASWAQNTIAGIYAGIDCLTLPANDTGNGTAIHGNTLNWGVLSPGNAASTVYGVAFKAQNGNQGTVAIVGNVIQGGVVPATAGIIIANATNTSTIIATSTGNNVNGWTTALSQVPSGGSFTLTAGI
jgi:hypothetical protein